jgi:hypothetical protein
MRRLPSNQKPDRLQTRVCAWMTVQSASTRPSGKIGGEAGKGIA